MKELIKAIRSAANMNQEQFASVLGTTPLSINRWENGKTLPNRMAQTQIYNFCKEYAINVTQLIVDTKAHADADQKLILYHGSKKGIDGDIAPLSRSECDFGRGFYMGTNTLQPLTLICNENKPKFYTVERGYNSEAFIKAFMTSSIAIDMDKEFHHIQWAGKAYSLSRMEDELADQLTKGEELYDKEALYWMGYIYRYWNFYTGESSREIYKQASAKTMNVVYFMYHTMSPEMSIDRLKERHEENN